MVRTNPIPEGLGGRPFSEQAEALPAREALRAVLSEAPGFRDETPDPVTFATGLLPLANAIFRGDMPLHSILRRRSDQEAGYLYQRKQQRLFPEDFSAISIQLDEDTVRTELVGKPMTAG